MRIFLLLLSALLISNCAMTQEIIKINISDGDTLTGQLNMPIRKQIPKSLVVFIHGTGPNTYLNKRIIAGKMINYFDLFSQEFNKRGIAFFSYNRRGVKLSDNPPTFDTILIKQYKKYLPSTEVKDIGFVLKYLRQDKRLKEAKIILLGWSEGTIIAPLVALDKKNNVDAVFLAGYVNEKMEDIIRWQNSGGSSMVNFCKYFDADSNKIISKSEYESIDPKISSVRKNIFKETPFSAFDTNGDSLLTASDFKKINEKRCDQILNAFERGDNEWIWSNYFHVTTEWYKDHKKLEPNKTTLLQLSIPILIFQGREDANTPVEGAYDIQKRFQNASKSNLSCFFFESHDHDLNYLSWPIKGVISPGLKKIFDTAEELF